MGLAASFQQVSFIWAHYIMCLHPTLLFPPHFQNRIEQILVSDRWENTISCFFKTFCKSAAEDEPQASALHLSLSLFFFALFCKFFVEDPGGAIEDVLTTGSPEVLVFTSHMNLTNDSLSDYQGENRGGNKFYLPVSLWNGIFCPS